MQVKKIRNEQKRVHCTLTVQPGAQDDCRSVFLHEPRMRKPRGYRGMLMHALSHTCCSLRRRDNKAMRLFKSLTAHGMLAKLTVRLLCVIIILLMRNGGSNHKLEIQVYKFNPFRPGWIYTLS